MISKIQQRITSFYLWVLIIFLLKSQTVFSNQIVDLMNALRNKTTDDVRSKINLASEFRDVLQTIQKHYYNISVRPCLPGFHFYNGSCYYLSPMTSTWKSASRSCSKIRNSSLVTLTTKDEFDFVVNTVLKPSDVKQAFVGLLYSTNERKWYWLDGRTLHDKTFGHLLHEYRRETSHCGIINIVSKIEVAFEGRNCETDDARYVCKYVQNYCYGKNLCSGRGECMSMGMEYKCRCNFLYRGKKCESFSSKGLQTIVAFVLIILMGLIGCFLKFDICSHCQLRNRRHSLDDFINEHQTILDAHERKKSMSQY
ncbi:unnamed protein product [Rotaria magnacalcarata]|uniref:C-type lectin domain-containing protein n=4 Tax=Rotaria magnacalcarata TaxID=392030 RepID=A0A815EVH9_9BILA|nr:unnamed protein product [Rotaria magnacalcarata]